MSQTEQFLLHQQLQKQSLEKKLEKSLQRSNLNDSNSSLDLQPSVPPLKPRMRAISHGYFHDSLNESLKNISSPASLSSSFSNSSLSNSSSCLFDSFEKKLAITGNIFQKRDNWTIIAKLPTNKQNSIHIRCNDEGPYGNDEIRCFVLAHLSSKNVTDITCLLCTCNLVVYDRFPLIDGLLFTSPFNYK